MTFLDVSHPWYVPRLRRIVITTLCLIWAGIELWGGNAFWASLATVMAVLCLWKLILTYTPPQAAKDPPPEG